MADRAIVLALAKPGAGDRPVRDAESPTQGPPALGHIGGETGMPTRMAKALATRSGLPPGPGILLPTGLPRHQAEIVPSDE